jgi:hypothetical protein
VAPHFAGRHAAFLLSFGVWNYVRGLRELWKMRRKASSKVQVGILPGLQDAERGQRYSVRVLWSAAAEPTRQAFVKQPKKQWYMFYHLD